MSMRPYAGEDQGVSSFVLISDAAAGLKEAIGPALGSSHCSAFILVSPLLRGSG